MKMKPLDLISDLKLWRKYKKGMCESCIGLCCYLPVEVKLADLLRIGILTDFHLEMSERDMVREALKHPAINRYTKSTEKFTFNQKLNSSCFYLDETGDCSIYENRPDTCRNHPEVGPKPGSCAYYPK
jgi:Fe-S-cluster containining protein